MYIIPKQVNLAIVPSQITPVAHFGGHFPKWPLSQKLRGAEPSTLTLYIRFVWRRFKKKYCKMYHTTLSDIRKAIFFYKMAAISQLMRLSQKLRGAEPSMLT